MICVYEKDTLEVLNIGPWHEDQLPGNSVQEDVELLMIKGRYIHPDNWRLARELSYPQITDQMDMMYHDMQAWHDAIQAVKDKYPKPVS